MMMLTEKSEPVPIMVVDDDEIDIEIICDLLLSSGVKNPIEIARHGEEALSILDDEGRDRPGLILLDLNMPRMNGFEFLEQLRVRAEKQVEIIFVLSTSERREDIENAYSYNVAGYVLKDDVQSLADILAKYCCINRFPPARA